MDTIVEDFGSSVEGSHVPSVKDIVRLLGMEATDLTDRVKGSPPIYCFPFNWKLIYLIENWKFILLKIDLIETIDMHKLFTIHITYTSGYLRKHLPTQTILSEPEVD